MVLTFENVALQPRIRKGALPHKLFSAPLRKRRIAATTCSREVNGKSTWVPGMFTISTLDSSRRTRSMDTARNRAIYFCSPGEVGCSLGRLPAAYIHHCLGIDGKGRREEGFVPRGDGRLGGRRVAPPKFHDSRPNRPANRARRTQSRVSNVQRPHAVISIGYVPPRIGGEPARIPRLIQFPSRSLAPASSRFGRTFLASFPQVQYIPT